MLLSLVVLLPLVCAHQKRFLIDDISNVPVMTNISIPTHPTTPRTTLPVPVQTTMAHQSTTKGEECRDKIDTCSHYGKIACTQEVYGPWARDKCALYCGFCTPALEIINRCDDKVPNCPEYDDGRLCSEPQFYVWAFENCKNYCKFDECNVTDCDNNPLFECRELDLAVGICSDIQKARLVCKKYCGLCDIRDCSWQEWGEWSSCGATCGTGLISRNRTLIPEVHGGLPCTASSLDVASCTMDPCPIDGGWSSWSPWSGCSVDCGIGLEKRIRSCNNPTPAIGGDHCFGDPSSYRVCIGSSCPNGTWSEWSEWSECDTTGRRYRDRICSSPATPLARLTSCEGSDMEEEVCNIFLANAVVHCVNACTNAVGGVRLCEGVNNKTCSTSAGRVEVYHNETWGTVCDLGFSTQDALVICHMFGFNSGSTRSTSTSTYSSGSGPILMSNVTCAGSEPSIQTCSFNGWIETDNSTCTAAHHSAGVYCS